VEKRYRSQTPPRARGHNPSAIDFGKTQLSILQTYRDDFGKYAKRAQLDLIQKVFQTAPAMVGQTYKCSQIDRESQIRDIKIALQLLEKAGVVTRVLSTSGHGLPFLKDASQAEVDFLTNDGYEIIPVEVKSGKTGSLKSLKLFFARTP
jgi:hypothetical protein